MFRFVYQCSLCVCMFPKCVWARTRARVCVCVHARACVRVQLQAAYTCYLKQETLTLFVFQSLHSPLWNSDFVSKGYNQRRKTKTEIMIEFIGSDEVFLPQSRVAVVSEGWFF